MEEDEGVEGCGYCEEEEGQHFRSLLGWNSGNREEEEN